MRQALYITLLFLGNALMACSGDTYIGGALSGESRDDSASSHDTADNDLAGANSDTDSGSDLDDVTGDIADSLPPDIATDVTAAYLAHPGGIRPLGPIIAQLNPSGPVKTDLPAGTNIPNLLVDAQNLLVLTYYRLGSDGQFAATGLIPGTELGVSRQRNSQITLAWATEFPGYFQYGLVDTPATSRIEVSGIPGSPNGGSPGGNPLGSNGGSLDAAVIDQNLTRSFGQFDNNFAEYSSILRLNLQASDFSAPKFVPSSNTNFDNINYPAAPIFAAYQEDAADPNSWLANPIRQRPDGTLERLEFDGDNILFHNARLEANDFSLRVHVQLADIDTTKAQRQFVFTWHSVRPADGPPDYLYALYVLWPAYNPPMFVIQQTPIGSSPVVGGNGRLDRGRVDPDANTVSWALSTVNPQPEGHYLVTMQNTGGVITGNVNAESRVMPGGGPGIPNLEVGTIGCLGGNCGSGVQDRLGGNIFQVDLINAASTEVLEDHDLRWTQIIQEFDLSP